MSLALIVISAAVGFLFYEVYTLQKKAKKIEE